MNKLESPSPKDALCQVWLKLAQWFWRRRFFIFVNVFSLFRNYLPLEKGRTLYLNKLESPSPKDALCQVWLKLAQWFWRRRWKYEKFTTTTTMTTTTMTTTTTTTDNGQILIRKAHLSLRLRWAKKYSVYVALTIIFCVDCWLVYIQLLLNHDWVIFQIFMVNLTEDTRWSVSYEPSFAEKCWSWLWTREMDKFHQKSSLETCNSQGLFYF